MRILIADDEITNSQLIKSILSPHGECKIVTNGEQAVNAFKKSINEDKPYDLICLDIIMPKLDGQNALKIIRTIEEKLGISEDKRVKVIMITSLSDQTNIIKAISQGKANHYIVKPIKRKTLIQEIKKIGLIK